MARVNVEDTLYKDIRFHDLIPKMGGTDAALGAVVRAWSVAQEFWLVNHVGIPLPVWKGQRLRSELIEVDLAEIRGDFVYIRGSEEQFAWLDACSNNGKKNREHTKKATPEIITKKEDRPISTDEHRRLQATSSSSSFSSSNKEENTFQKREKKSKQRKPRALDYEYTQTFLSLWDHYGRIGKKKYASECYEKQNLSPEEIGLLTKAISTYLAKEGRDETYRMHFSTFLNEDWRSHLEKPRSRHDFGFKDSTEGLNGG